MVLDKKTDVKRKNAKLIKQKTNKQEESEKTTKDSREKTSN